MAAGRSTSRYSNMSKASIILDAFIVTISVLCVGDLGSYSFVVSEFVALWFACLF